MWLGRASGRMCSMKLPRLTERTDFSRRLRAKGITPTLQRVEVAKIILARPQHLSAEQVLGLVQRAGFNVSKATVYNTLGLFARNGLLREVFIDPSKVFYDSNTTHHFHFYDVERCTLIDIRPEQIPLAALPMVPPGTVVEGVDVVVRVRSEKA